MEGKIWLIPVFSLFAIAALLGSLAVLFEEHNTSFLTQKDMYEIEFTTDDGQVTVWADIDGVVKKSTTDEGIWVSKVIIRVAELQPNDMMQMYGLFSNVVISEDFQVTRIVKNTVENEHTLHR